MHTLTLNLPMMYGDHHVLSVRQILLGLPGIEKVYASSSFHIVEIHYDPHLIGEDAIRKAMDNTGYRSELTLPMETGMAGYGEKDDKTFFRHTTASEQTKQVVSFAQDVIYSGQPLWPCPGIGVVSVMDEENN